VRNRTLVLLGDNEEEKAGVLECWSIGEMRWEEE